MYTHIHVYISIIYLFECYIVISWASLIVQLVKSLPAMQGIPVQFLGWEDLLEKGQGTHSSILGLPLWPAGKEPTCNVGDLGSIPRLGKSPGEGKDYPLHYSGLENSLDWRVHGVTKSQTQLRDFHFHVLQKVGWTVLAEVKCIPFK